jgi:hypothetical protein
MTFCVVSAVTSSTLLYPQIAGVWTKRAISGTSSTAASISYFAATTITRRTMLKIPVVINDLSIITNSMTVPRVAP